jgi:hypothetical protein
MAGFDLLKLTDKRPDAEINSLVDAVIADAGATWGPEKFDGEYPKSGFGIGILRPKDVQVEDGSAESGAVGSIYWGASIAAASTWQDWINISTSEDCYIIVTGIFCLDATPNVTAIRPYIDGEDMPVIDIEQLYSWDEAKGWFSKPFAVKPQKSFKLRIVGKTAGVAKIGLLGYVVAKRGYLITE